MPGKPPPPAMGYSRAGRMRTRIGKSAEQYAEALHEVCRAKRVATVRKMPTPIRVMRVQGVRVQGVFAERSGTDYMGHMRDGRAVYVEAKHCAKVSLPLSVIAPHQRQILDDADDAGAVAVLLVVYHPRPIAPEMACAIPWRVVREHIARDAKSLPPEHITPHAVRLGEAYLERWRKS